MSILSSQKPPKFIKEFGDMTTEHKPADWAIQRAMEETESEYLLDAFARYIEKHEQPPVDPDVLDVRRIAAAWVMNEEVAKRVLAGKYDKAPYFKCAFAEYKKIKGERGMTCKPYISRIMNCHFITRPEDPVLFNFDVELDGLAEINLNGYLVVPVELFTPRQVKLAVKRWDKRRAHAQDTSK